MRNLSPPSMCNGTRLLIKELKENLIVATIMTGPAAGQLAHIPRIPMILTDLPIPFKRLQFPLGSICERNILLMVNYTLAYRGSPENQFIFLPQNKTASNIVYREALTQ
ncbi:unnamed protein product [Pieris macdunnoughi]|uniref:Uncharacterized protein n=1 Tax=Pieris macdunnoughi TaxID=345717 RepID=A0A821W1Z3_9NEOP|nr:unnamed protein product [Pieris macdunnoughi]